MSRESSGVPRVLAATGNLHKLAELVRLLRGVDVVGLADEPALAEAPAPEESGETFFENAAIKAITWSRLTDLPVLADDSGLCVDWLAGRPGVRSARYGGPGLTDRERWQRLLEEMRGVAGPLRGAHYRAAVALARGGRLLCAHEGACAGSLLDAPRGTGGFGYDPIFLVTALGKSMAELTPEEKDSISHRARAVAGLAESLRGGVLAES